jgi:hypothetical protein
MIKTDDYSEKRERKVQTKRIPNYLHTRLMKIKSTHHNRSLFDALLYCAEVGLSVLEEREKFHAINVQNGEGRWVV